MAGRLFSLATTIVDPADNRPCCPHEAYAKVFHHIARAMRRRDVFALFSTRDDILALTGREGIIARIALLDAQRQRLQRSRDELCGLVCEASCALKRWRETESRLDVAEVPGERWVP